MITHVSTTEAHGLQQEGHVYVDVRSTQEFAAAHPAGAVNVPLLEPDPDTGQMLPNPDFVRVMQAHFKTDAKVVIGCQAGRRSLRAAQILESFGFTDLVNVLGGFGGAGGMGGAYDQGWVDAGLPVETGQTPGRAYADLAARADAGPS
jgi:rhodanese-related sulfurtransferase